MKIHTKLPSCTIARTRCFVPLRTQSIRMSELSTNKSSHSWHNKPMIPLISINNQRSIRIRSFRTESGTKHNEATVLQKQITVAMSERDFAKAINLLEKLKTLSQDDSVLNDGIQEKFLTKLLAFEKLGFCYHATSKLKESIESYQQSLSLARKLNDIKKIAKSLSLLGSLQIAVKDYENGNAILKEGLKLAVEIKDPMLRGHINSSLGISFSNQEIPDAAIKYFMDCLEDFKEARNSGLVQRITRLVAQEYAKMKAFELSNSYWEQFLKYSRNIDDKEGQFKALDNIAKNFMRISKPRDSRISYEKALALAKEMQNAQLERDCLIGLAKACEVLGETTQAKKYSNQALKFAQDAMDASGEVNALIVRATQAVAAREFDSCVEDAKKIVELSEKHNHKQGEMYGRLLLGAVAEQQREWTLAKDHFEKALALAKAVNDNQSSRKCQDMLSVIYFNLGDFSAPIPLLHDLLKAYEADKDDLARLRCISRMYLCYKNLGKQQHADIYMKLCNILANQLVEQGVIPSLDKLNEFIPTSSA